MPYYNYKCSECDHAWEELRKISEMNTPVEQPCPECKVSGKIEKLLSGAPMMGDPLRLGRMKTSDGFKDVLKKIHERTPGSQLDKISTLTKL